MRMVSCFMVLALGVLLGTGQLVGSFLIDVLFPVANQAFTTTRLIGIALAVAGAAVVKMRK